MNTPLRTFSSLAQLIDWDHAEPPSPQCAYLVRAERPCEGRISRSICKQAQLLIADDLQLLTGILDDCDEECLRVNLLKELAAIHLCYNHQHYRSYAAEQWLKEIGEKSELILATLKEYYHFEVEETDRETEDDTDNISSLGDDHDSDDKQSVSEEEQIGDEEYTLEEEYSSEEEGTSEEENTFGDEVATEERDASEEKHVRVEQEGVSENGHHPQEHSPPIQLLRRAFTLEEDEVAREVTHLLEQRVGKYAKKPGWIYAIGPNDIPGKFKVGISFSPPPLQRFCQHKRCYGKFEVLAMQLIPYVHRVEQLILKELSNKRYMLEKGCQKCDRSHREFLEVDKKTLLRSLDKWIRFVQSFPYSNTGKLTKESKEELPPPALRSYLGCKPARRRASHWTPRKKEGDRDFGIVSPPILGSKVPILDKKNVTVHEFEVNQDELSSAVEDLHLGRSRTKQTVP